MDLEEYPYLTWCYENRKWAFLSDFVRLLVVYRHGGIYLDTDVEVIKPFDDLLDCQAFYGFENDEFVASGLGFGAVVGHVSVKNMIDLYSCMQADENGVFNMIGCPSLNTKALLSMGLKCNGQYQTFNGVTVLPAEYFNPYDNSTGRSRKTVNTYSVHWYAKSALSPWCIFRSKITRPIHRIFGVNSLKWLKRR